MTDLSPQEPHPRPPDPEASLRLPSPPVAPAAPAAYPRIPSGPPRRTPAAARRTPRLVTVALVGLLAAALGSGATLIAVDRLTPESPVAAPVAAPRTVQAPTVELGDDPAPDPVAAVARAVLPSVVRVDIEGGGTLPGRAGNGSGVIYRSDGHIITNNHVVAEADALSVMLSDGTELDAQVVGTDPQNDLAVIRVDRDDLPAIQIGDSSQLEPGELAVAVGSPFGLEGSVTAGVVSAINRGPIRVGGAAGQGLSLPSVVQTDAPINPGNSGGALVGGDGRLIGINSAILTTGVPTGNAGVGFAIPVNVAVDVADELIETGFVRHPLLGVQLQALTPEMAERLGVEEGAWVAAVQPDTPAEEAGLQTDDVIVELGGEPIDSMDELISAIREREVDETVEVTYIRNGEEQTVEVTLIERPRDE